MPFLAFKFKYYVFFVALLKDQSFFMSSQIKQDAYGYTLVAKDNSPLGISVDDVDRSRRKTKSY